MPGALTNDRAASRYLFRKARPFPDLRDAHAPIRLTANREPVLHRSRSQARSKSVEASLVRADSFDVKMLTDFESMDAVGKLAVLAGLLDPWTKKGVLQRDATLNCRTKPRQPDLQGRNRGRRSSCDDDDRMRWTDWRSLRSRRVALLVRTFPLRRFYGDFAHSMGFGSVGAFHMCRQPL